MKRYILIMLAASTPAASQTTTCTGSGDSVICNTTPPLGSGGTFADAVQRGMERGRQQRAEQTRRRVGQLVAAGDCAGAEKLALKAGDFELADTVRGYCAR